MKDRRADRYNGIKIRLTTFGLRDIYEKKMKLNYMIVKLLREFLKYFLVLEFAAVVVYGGRPDAPTGSLSDSLFDEGVRMGSWGLLLHSITGSDILYR